MKVGLVGESASDTSAIQNLLSKRYKTFEFIVLLNGLTGAALDSKKILAQYLSVEIHEKKPDMIILIRDLDSHEKDKTKLAKRDKIFRFFNHRAGNKGLFLLNIYELEALIFADIDKFNKLYDCSIDHVEDPMKIPDPKGELKKATIGKRKLFNVSHNPEIFKALDFDKLKQNCRYFETFSNELEKMVAQ